MSYKSSKLDTFTGWFVLIGLGLMLGSVMIIAIRLIIGVPTTGFTSRRFGVFLLGLVTFGVGLLVAIYDLYRN